MTLYQHSLSTFPINTLPVVTLYRHSTSTRSINTFCCSWFPLFLPLTTPLRVKKGEELTVCVWRCTSVSKVFIDILSVCYLFIICILSIFILSFFQDIHRYIVCIILKKTNLNSYLNPTWTLTLTLTLTQLNPSTALGLVWVVCNFTGCDPLAKPKWLKLLAQQISGLFCLI